MNAAPSTATNEKPQWGGPVTGCAFSFVAGYVDAVGFSALFGLFTAHVTGNFIMIGVELAGDTPGLFAKLLALPVFVVAVAATRLAETGAVRGGRQPLPMLLLAEAVLLLLFMAIGMHALPTSDAADPTAVLAGMFAVAAMGVQNALSRTALGDLGPTTIMTGNTTQVVIDLVDLRSASGAQRAQVFGRLRKMAPAIAAFAVGAIVGALSYTAMFMFCMVLPIVVLGWVTWSIWRIAKREASRRVQSPSGAQ